MAYTIDTHSHYMPPEVAEHTAFFKAGWSDIRHHLKTMDAHTIDKALLVYPTSDAHLNMGGWSNLCKIYNEKIADVVRQHPDRLIGAGIIPIDAPDRYADECTRMRSLGLKVISLASSYDGVYLDDQKFFPVYEFASKYKIPVHVHPQILNPIGEERVRDPLLSPVLEYVFDVSICIGKMMMSGTFMKFQEVKFIFAHYGGVLPLLKERFDTTYQMLRKRNFVKDIFILPSEYFRNIYFDTSGSKSPGSLACALELAEPSHIFFGSDFPANQAIDEALSVIKKAPLKEEERRLMLENNLLKLL
ncbi:MAG TPA: amidohydrolase family protein [Candidatus Omnitrophota bacterium]|nr:amidohydrolase family protein [Candidatus Omnitrophota bacterium]